MVRWEPGTRERLRAAALELFASRGFDETTAADIAARAGVTERTFFRHYADKRDVLFLGEDEFVGSFTAGIAAAPADATAMELVAAALRSGASYFADERRASSRDRQAVIEANGALLEREHHKAAALGEALGTALRTHGVAEPSATLAAQVCATVFHISFQQWIADGETRSLDEIERSVLADFATLSRA